MVKDIGLEQLYCPDIPQEILADIVFVHGLFGHRRKTWTKHLKSESSKRKRSQLPEGSVKRPSFSIRNLLFGTSNPPANTRPETVSMQLPAADEDYSELTREVFWPRDLLPQKLPDCRILTWGYDVDIDHALSSASTATVFQHANNLLSDLADVRILEEEKARPIIFVAHSLGGIVVKDALNRSRTAPTHLKEILPSTFGVCFIGTPHRGSPTATLGETVFRITGLLGKSPNLQVLQALKYDAETLDRVQVGFKETLISQKIRIRSFREAEKTKGITIVDRFSSTIDDSEEIVTDIPANHSNMTKFESCSEPGFISVSSALKRFCGEMNQIKKTQDDLVKLMRKDCLSSLQNSERGSRVEQVEETYRNTYSWLFDGRVGFEDWLRLPSSTNPIYWIQGKPGSGKSTLMKYALKHKTTKKLLKESHGGTWTLIPFFFHDRGFAEVQKTVDGFLQELLFKLIFHHPDLVKVLYHIRLEALEFLLDQQSYPRSADASGLETERVTKVLELYNEYCSTHPVFPWSMHKIEEAFRAIIEQNQITLRVCLFIDALDEHSGNHGKLVKMLKEFATKGSTDTVHIKLCLASRPAPIFTTAFNAYPGFAIHEHTENDIEFYASGRIQSELTQDKGTHNDVQLDELSADIVKKAEGVFIWVRLVVDELVERIVDGDTIPQLLGVLLTIPTELEDLYRRILSRIKPEYRRESYIIFQVMLSCVTSITLNELMAVLDVALGGEVAKMPQESMQRRLYSRCGGLLQIKTTDLTRSYTDPGPIQSIEFLHQTSKSFIQDTSNTRLLSEVGANVSTRDGRISLLKFCIHVVTEMDSNDVKLFRVIVEKMFEYARLLDSSSHTDFLVKTLDRLLLKRVRVLKRYILSGWLRRELASGLDVFLNFYVIREFLERLEHTFFLPEDRLLGYAVMHGVTSYLTAKVQGRIKPAAPIGLLEVMLDPPGSFSLVKEEDVAMLVTEWSITGLAQPQDVQPVDWSRYVEPKDWLLGDSGSEESQSEESQSEGPQPEDSQPEDSQPEDSQPEDSQPEDSQSEDSLLEDSQSEDLQPEDLQLEDLPPEDSHFWADLFTGGLRLDSLV